MRTLFHTSANRDTYERNYKQRQKPRRESMPNNNVTDITRVRNRHYIMSTNKQLPKKHSNTNSRGSTINQNLYANPKKDIAR